MICKDFWLHSSLCYPSTIPKQARQKNKSSNLFDYDISLDSASNGQLRGMRPVCSLVEDLV